MKEIEDIESRIESDDTQVLKLCDEFLDECVEKERRRGESAERRANITLGIIGAISVFLVFFAGDVSVNLNRIQVLWNILYAASALWLARSVWYSMKAIRTQSRFHITAESIFEFQKGQNNTALKKKIAGKYWEHQQSVQPNTERLFYAQRAQRSLVFVVVLILCLGALIATESYIDSIYLECLSLAAAFALLVFWFFGDWAIEKIGIWG